MAEAAAKEAAVIQAATDTLNGDAGSLATNISGARMRRASTRSKGLLGRLTGGKGDADEAENEVSGWMALDCPRSPSEHAVAGAGLRLGVGARQ